MKKKVSELSKNELYEHFKKGVIETVKRHFNGRKEDLLEPAVFLGVKNSGMEEIAKRDKFVKEQMEMHDKIKPEGYKDYSIQTPLIPLGPFFEDHGSEEFNQVAKGAAMRLVKHAIREVNKNDMSAVMFSCFVSECFMAKAEGTAKDNIALHLGDTDVIDGAMKGYKKVSEMPNAEEKVILIFETSQTTEMIQFDILFSPDNNDKMMHSEKSLGKTTSPAQGIMAGILHTPETAFTAN